MMALELEPVDLHSLLSNSLSIVKEKAAAQRIHLDLEIRRRTWATVAAGRAQDQADRLQPAVQRGQVQRQRRPRDAARAPVPRGSRRPVWPAPGRCTAFRWPTASSTSFSRSASATPASASRSRTWRSCSRPSARSTAAWRASSRAPASAWRWSSSWPSCMAARVAVASAGGRGRALRRLAAAACPGPGRSRAARPRRAMRPAIAVERTALVVEDDEPAAELVRLLLEAEGFTVLRAASAEAALAMVAAAAAEPDHAGHPVAGHRRLGIPAARFAKTARWPACRWSSSPARPTATWRLLAAPPLCCRSRSDARN